MQPVEQSQRELCEMGFTVSKESPANGGADGYWGVMVADSAQRTISVTAHGRERAWLAVVEAARRNGNE